MMIGDFEIDNGDLTQKSISKKERKKKETIKNIGGLMEVKIKKQKVVSYDIIQRRKEKRKKVNQKYHAQKRDKQQIETEPLQNIDNQPRQRTIRYANNASTSRGIGPIDKENISPHSNGNVSHVQNDFSKECNKMTERNKQRGKNKILFTTGETIEEQNDARYYEIGNNEETSITGEHHFIHDEENTEICSPITYETQNEVRDDTEVHLNPINEDDPYDFVYDRTPVVHRVLAGRTKYNDLTNMKSGVYTFRAHGGIYHRIDQLVPRDGKLSLRDLGPLDNYRVTWNASVELDHRVYNRPTTAEVVGIWVDGNENITTYKRSIVVYGRSDYSAQIQPYEVYYDPLSYPLFFPNGESGWHSRIARNSMPINEIVVNEENMEEDVEGRTSKKKKYCINAGVLFLQVSNVLKLNQKKIRSELYQGIVDCVNVGEVEPSKVGQRVILPASFIKGPRDMRRRFLDAMTLVQDDGKPDIFLTITCNPGWPEITDYLEPGQDAQDRPDLVSRVLRAKLEDLKDQLLIRHILGKVRAYVYVVEFQKRGLPHAHFLLIMRAEDNLKNPEQYDQKLVRFSDNDIITDIVDRERDKSSMLTAFFKINIVDGVARKYLYKEFPTYFTWNPSKRCWNQRKKAAMRGRLVSANPAEGERYYLRVLLSHVKGPTCFDDLYTVNNELYPTFRKAAVERGLVETDDNLSQCLTKASLFQFPAALRRLFATILIYCEPGDVRKLWDEQYNSLSEDYSRQCQSYERVKTMVLVDIGVFLQSMELGGYQEVQEEYSIVVEDEHVRAKDSLNSDQKVAYDEIMRHVDCNLSGVFFIDGPGGTGKTFLYKALLEEVRSRGLIALATASSGAAANNMPGGRTAHSRFKIPINLDNNSMCNIKQQSGVAQLLRLAKIIIWDESSMAHRQAVEAVDRSIQDITKLNLPFGGKIMILGGDFRQVLPVVRRALADPWFSKFLMRVGDGEEGAIDGTFIRIPDDMSIPYTDKV
ncbi:hypothetical protein LXL04_028734 [Taraxacum kok-saghyz]